MESNKRPHAHTSACACAHISTRRARVHARGGGGAQRPQPGGAPRGARALAQALRAAARAARAGAQRLQGDLPSNAHPPVGVCYRSLVDYTKQVQRFFQLFGRENVLVVIFDELKRTPESTLHQILDFLRNAQKSM